MYDNLGELVTNFPIGMKIKLTDKERDDYGQGKFVVEGYLYVAETEMWYPAHKLGNGDWEIYKQ